MTAPTQERWNQLWKEAGITQPPTDWYSRLTHLYTEPDRSYHSFRHIADCLAEFDQAKALIQDPVAVELAIWFHDAIYNSRKTDNEQRSADLARQCLDEAKAKPTLIQKVYDLILATQHHQANSTPDTAVLIDIDFSILGQPEKRYHEYEEQVRQEYMWVPLEVFAAKRAELLREILNRPRIYTTEQFYKRYEEQARKNLRDTITKTRNLAR